MSRYLVISVLALLCHAGALAQEKPDLRGARIIAPVDCPDKKEDTCLALWKSGEHYIVKGNGPGKEESIWKIDAEGAAKGQDFASYQKYIILVWSKYSI